MGLCYRSCGTLYYSFTCGLNSCGGLLFTPTWRDVFYLGTPWYFPVLQLLPLYKMRHELFILIMNGIVI